MYKASYQIFCTVSYQLIPWIQQSSHYNYCSFVIKDTGPVKFNNVSKFIGLFSGKSALNLDIYVPGVQVSGLSPLMNWTGEEFMTCKLESCMFLYYVTIKVCSFTQTKIYFILPILYHGLPRDEFKWILLSSSFFSVVPLNVCAFSLD